MTKNKKLLLIFIAGFLLLALLAIFIGSKNNGYKDQSTYYKDPVSGDTFFSDPNQEPENAEANKKLSVIGTEFLATELSTDQLSEFRDILNQYLIDNNEYPTKQQRVYIVDKKVTRVDNNVNLQINVAEKNKTHAVVVVINRDNTVDLLFDGSTTPYVPDYGD